MLIYTAPLIAQEVVFYPKPESSSDTRPNYPLALLRMCEAKSKNQFRLQASMLNTQQGRSLRQLSQNMGITVAWALTTREREQELLPVRIPIDRGLIGWRIALISNNNKNLFAQLKSPTQLANLRAGQGHDWPDVEVLQAAGFNVTTGSSYEGLFTMLATGHVDYFPRALSEIWPELDSHLYLGLGVDTQWVIHYPAALYFFVNKDNAALAKTLEVCLTNAIHDGSFQTIFNNYFQQSLDRAQLSKRKIIHLKNPTLPEATPLDKPELWYSPPDQ